MGKDKIPKICKPEKVPKPDKTAEYLQEWKKEIIALRPEEIQVFVHGEADLREVVEVNSKIQFRRLDGLARSEDLRMVIVFSGYLRNELGEVGLGFAGGRAFFDFDVTEFDETMDEIDPTGRIDWQKMYDIIVVFEEVRRNEIVPFVRPGSLRENSTRFPS